MDDLRWNLLLRPIEAGKVRLSLSLLHRFRDMIASWLLVGGRRFSAERSSGGRFFGFHLHLFRNQAARCLTVQRAVLLLIRCDGSADRLKSGRLKSNYELQWPDPCERDHRTRDFSTENSVV